MNAYDSFIYHRRVLNLKLTQDMLNVLIKNLGNEFLALNYGISKIIGDFHILHYHQIQRVVFFNF